MPYAVAHMIIPMIILDILRDNILKIKRKKFQNRYILVAGLAGLLPDTDLILSFLFPGSILHRGITHTIWPALIFLVVFSVFHFVKKHNASKIFLMIAIGLFSHVVLDLVTAGTIKIFYPISDMPFSVDLVPKILPNIQVGFVYASMDAILLFMWFIRMFIKKRVQDVF